MTPPEDPTPDMIERGIRVAAATGVLLTPTQAHDIWQAMYDEWEDEYGPGDWTNGEVEAAKALWDANNPYRRVGLLHPTIADAWMRYLPDARTCFRVFRSYL